MKRFDDLQYNGLILVQDTEYPCFSEDSVLLANYMRRWVRKKDRVIDLGSGTGVISVLGQAKTGASFTGVEKHGALCALARESAALNGQDIPFCEMDVSDAPAAFGDGSFTAAVCNPPYYSSGDRSSSRLRADARHTDAGGLGTFASAASKLLQSGGLFFLCYPADQLCEMVVCLRRNCLEPKWIRFIPRKDLVPRLTLVCAKKNARPGVRFDALYDVTDAYVQ